MSKIILNHDEPGMNASSDDLAKVVISRLGLVPRKKGSTDKMHLLLLEFYERSKRANREKNPREAVITVEEMGSIAGITRQTMYDYLKRWLVLDVITKTSFVGKDNEVIIGYKLNGATLENAFDKAKTKVVNHLDATSNYIKELQRIVKNEKLRQTQKEKGPGEDIPAGPAPELAQSENK